ncbi:class I SAM-dependent methyltransferase [Sphingobacterium lactis]|uniref:class I SAM-dependent methyltransferase n=1 Tax=Sphingobacterium lactis TaxID=797291 RepID=UPI003F7FDEDF
MYGNSFEEGSYERHAGWYHRQFPDMEKKMRVIRTFKTYQGSIHHWLQDQFFQQLGPLLHDKEASWLTLGDAYGHDAQYLLSQNIKSVTASDLNDNLLQLAKQEGLIHQFQRLNAERMNLESSSLDYVLCKESYHHFPRPYAALYEMVRVARKAIVLMEPQDPLIRMPILLALYNVLNRVQPGLIDKVWKNRISYESVGNFVYKVSERELEKFAAGLNLPMIATKSFNPNFWFEGSDQIEAKLSAPKFLRIRLKKMLLDLLMKLGIIPGQTLCMIAFKEVPNTEVLNCLKHAGFRISKIKANPYI